MAFNFVEYFIEYYKERESPEIFWKWSAIGCLAAVLRDNIFLQVHDDIYYPNMYIILIADSGLYRKGAPCKAASKLIQDVGNTKFISGRTSMQAFVRDLGQDTTNDDGKLVRGASGVLYSEELSGLLVKDPATVPILIDIYDYHGDWSNNLVSLGKFKLRDVCVSLIAASNSSMFSKIDTSTEDGLLGRTFIIKPTEKRPRKSLFALARSQNKIDKAPLLDHLKKVSRLKGRINYSQEVERYYDEWYYAIPSEIFSDRIGYGSRLGTHVLKVALALAAARESFDKEIITEDIVEAINLCTQLRKNYKQIALSAGLSSRSNQVNIIVQILLKSDKYRISRSKLIQRTLGDIEGEILDSILLYMVHAELVKEIAIKGSVGYMLTAQAIEWLLGDKE